MSGIFEIVGAILVSLGGGSVIIFGLSKWLGDIWAQRVIGKEQQKYQIELQKLVTQGNEELERLKDINTSNMDLTMRKREIYQKLVLSMGIHLGRSGENTSKEKFLENIDGIHLWASDEVLFAAKNFINQLIVFTNCQTDESQTLLKKRYAEVIIAMRKDVGFENTNFNVNDYQFVNFQKEKSDEEKE